MAEQLSVIFLDIDGVLNGHDWCEGAQSNTIRRACIEQLNRIVAATGAKIVLSSAWRYMIHGGAMSLLGFQYLLRTHGACHCDIIGVTVRDENTPGWSLENITFDARAAQIRLWVENNHIKRFVVIDDEGVSGFNGQFIQTDGACGLTNADADKAIFVLKGTP